MRLPHLEIHTVTPRQWRICDGRVDDDARRVLGSVLCEGRRALAPSPDRGTDFTREEGLMDPSFSPEFRATDVGEAEAHLRARYGSLALSDATLEFGERVRSDDEFSLVEHDYEGRFTIGGALDVISVGLPFRADGYQWEVGDERGVGAGQPVLFQPGQTFVTNVDRAYLRATVFDPAAIAREAAALFGVDAFDVRFASAKPRSRAIGRIWASTVEFAVERDDPAYRLLHASVRSALTRLLLEAFPLVGRPAEQRAGVVGRWLGYRRAVEFIDDNASLPITIADITAAAGLTSRELTLAFRAHARDGVTPLGMLRRARLDAARADLRASDPATVALDEIARRWGFASTARFLRDYRDAFGVDPAEARRTS